MENRTPCLNCGAKTLYRSREVSASGGYGPDLLPGLGRAIAGLIKTSGRFTLVVCADCGLARFFATAEARSRLADSRDWAKLE
jgi:predicted nucleic-acid-binding Zn-ribbon protein